MHKPTPRAVKQLGATQLVVRIARIIFVGLLAYAPLHIFISTVIGANLGGLNLLKVLKDIVALFGFCLMLGISFRQAWFIRWLKQPLVLLIISYGLLTVLLALVRPTDQGAEVLGVTYNLRFLIFFLYGWLLVQWLPAKELVSTSVKAVLWSAGIVVAFGLIQYWFLPNDALTHLGFTKANGVFPAFFIDDKPGLERVMSTVRDPNSLGSYLIIIATLLAATLARAKKNQRMFWAGSLTATGLCLFLTFSRSALLGLVLSLGALVMLLGKDKIKLSKKNLQRLVAVGLGVLLIIIGGLYTARNTYTVQNVVFHADQSTKQEDPNQLRVRFLKESLQTIADHPFGQGPGTAGLASIHNKVQGTKLNEDYYLQIASEVGILGLILFLTILAVVAKQVYAGLHDHPLAYVGLASLAGLLFTNVLVHIWSNEAVAYTWWGLAAITLTKVKKAQQ